MRVHLFEFEDFSWFPSVIRDGGTDYLRYFLIATELYKPCIPLITDTLAAVGENNIVDLCSGSGGYIEHVCNELNKTGMVTITVTDRFPNPSSYKMLQQRSNGLICYREDAVDVFNMPDGLKGVRTLFSAIHHFRPEEVKAILQQTVAAKAPVCIFDGGEKGLLPIIGMLIIHPLAFLLLTPFFRPLRLSRFLFTYLLPVIPLYTIWDGAVSVMRMYEPDELLQIAKTCDNDGYVWKCGKTRNRFGVRASYLIGYPKK